jgi:hypothetical protein
MWTRTKYRGAINVILLGCLLILAPISELAAQTDPAAKGLPVERESLKVTSAEENVPESLHPLAPAVRLARETAEFIDRSVQDYTCNLVMRERIKGRLKYHEVAHLKVRRAQWDEDHLLQPFSVYLHFLLPSRVKGREVLYVSDENNGDMIARNGGDNNLQDITLAMKPDSKRAMRGRHYPITEIGIGSIIARLMDEAELAMEADQERRECQVRFLEGAKIEGCSCQCIQVTFPVRREYLKFHIARIFLDDETKLPIRFAAYTWPRESGGPPRLMEEYTFLDLQVNVGLSDQDFDRQNPAYRFYLAEEGSLTQSSLAFPPDED